MIRIYPFERRMTFLGEKRSKTYEKYVTRAPQAKMLLCAKSKFKKQTCFALESYGG